MTFIWPWMHWFLLLIPLLAFVYIRLQIRRQKIAEKYDGFVLVAPAGKKKPGFRRHIPPIFFMAGLAVLIAALARPQMEINLPRVEGIVMLVFDVSGSMAADDLEPSRMEAAKSAARTFVERQPESVQVGVVAFSDNGFAIQPPTNDQASIIASIDRLSPQRGTSLAYGIVASLNMIISGSLPVTPEAGQTQNLIQTALELDQKYPYAVIVLMTDGENTVNPDPLEAAQVASDMDVRIHTVGIGSTAGAVIEVEGFSVHTSLDDEMLTQIAQMTGGVYHNAADEKELQEIYANITPKWLLKAEFLEVTAIFAGVGILLLLVGGAFSLVWFGRLP